MGYGQLADRRVGRPRRGTSTASAGASGGFDADRLAERWADGEPVADGPDDVTAAVDRFAPSDVPLEVWGRVERLVRGWVEEVGPPTVRRAKTLMNAGAQLALWADARGQPLDAQTLLHPTTIDRFFAEGCAHLTPGTRTNYRSMLRLLGREVIGPTLFPPPTLVVPRPNPRLPYTAAEVNGLVAWAAGLATEAMRSGMTILLALGLGAGLTAEEIRRLVGTDVTVDDGGVLVSVIGDRARQVPVLRRWERAVAAAAAAGTSPVFNSGRDRIRKHDTSNFVERCSDGHMTVSLQRLRTTWIVGQVQAGTPLVALAAAAGVNLAQLARYLPLVPVAEPAEIRQQLRNAEKLR